MTALNIGAGQDIRWPRETHRLAGQWVISGEGQQLPGLVHRRNLSPH